MKNHRYIRRKSQKQEKRTAKEFGGRTQLASGAIESVGMKGDIRTGETSSSFNSSDYLIENKFTDSPKYKFELKTWKKIGEEALRDNMRIPMMQIDIQDTQVVVLELRDYLTIIENASDKIKQEIISEVYQELVSTSKKSYTIDSNELSEKLEKYPLYELRLTFEGARPWTKFELAIVGKDDFMRITK